jgi:hypothetical protein
MREWWQCGDGGFHDINQFDLDTEMCGVCGMNIEEYWEGFQNACNDSEGYLGRAERTRRAASRGRSLAAMHTQESEDSSSPERPERAYLLMGVGE